MSDNIPPIGIDLGTTYSCVGIMLNGKVEIIPNDMGEKLTPSIISFLKKGNIIGEYANDQLIKNPKNTIYNVKRFIGRQYNDPEIKEDLSLYSFEIENINNIPKIIINIDKKRKEYLPEQISAMILSKLKSNVSKFINKEIKDAIITVPAYFNDNQRQATKQAGQIAQLNVLRIINEPTAAAIGFGLHKKLKENEKILVFDLGGGTFDVSLLELSDDMFEVIGTKGDTHLGGEDFDNKLVDFCIKKFNEVNYNINIKNEPSAMRRLKNACEKCKRELSFSLESTIDIDYLINRKSFYCKILRNDFEELCKELFDKCFDIVKSLLLETNTDKKSIKEIVLVGGSTRIPKIVEMIKELFDMKEPNKNINPDEIVAYGASIYAAIIKKIDDVEDLDFILFDVNPMSLGIGSINNKMSFVIPKYQKIPIKVTKTYYTTYDNQTSIKFPVYEGENKNTQFNHLLGCFKIYDIPINKKGEVSFDVTFEIDVNSILTVTAIEKSMKLSQKIVIVDGIANLSKNEIEKYIKECEILRKQEITNEDLKKIGNIKLKIYYLENKLKEKFINKNEKISYINNLIEYLSKYLYSINISELNNDTVLEKTNIYLKKLLNNYKLLLYEYNISFEQKQNIISKIRKIFKTIYSNKIQCLVGFIHILESQKEIYYSLKTFLMRLYFNEGLNNYNNKKYLIAKYFFLETQNFFQNKEDLVNFKDLHDEYNDIITSTVFYLKRIKVNQLMEIAFTYYKQAIYESETLDVKLIYTALDKYREAFKEISSSENLIDIEYEAKCLSQIIIIQYTILKTKELDTIYNLGMQCLNLANSLYSTNINNKEWYINVKEIIQEISKKKKISEKNNEEFKEQLKKEKPEIFEEIDREYSKSPIQFIKFILKKYPYKNYDSNLNIEKDYNTNPYELLKKLTSKYHPDRYKNKTIEEKEFYTIINYISALLNNIYSFNCSFNTPSQNI